MTKELGNDLSWLPWYITRTLVRMIYKTRRSQLKGHDVAKRNSLWNKSTKRMDDMTLGEQSSPIKIFEQSGRSTRLQLR